MIVVPPWESPKYLAWVRSRPSVISGSFGCVAHHLKGHGHGGTGTKVTDIWTFPLTPAEHTDSNEAIHHMGWRNWEEEHGSQWFFINLTMQMAFHDGILCATKDKIPGYLWQT